MRSFQNANVYIEGKGIVRTSVSFDARIRTIGEAAGEAIRLPENALVCPGFIDQHIHGAGSADTMDGSETALSVMADTLVKEGTTRFLATTMTQSREKTLRAARAVCAYRASNRAEGAGVLGMHLEGPFLSKKHIGAQPEQYVIAPSREFFDDVQRASGNCVRLVTIAPEEEGACELIAHMTAQNAAASVGHSDATFADVRRAVACGLTCVTHTFNAQRGVHHREIGVAGAAMLCDELYTELIADTIHVSVPAMRLLVKNKPHDKTIFITDAIRAKGLGEGESELGGQKVFVRGGEARLANGALAGSVLAMNAAMRNAVQQVGMSPCDAIDCATINPARHLGVAADYGSIAEGKCADFAVLDENFSVILCVRDGNIVFAA